MEKYNISDHLIDVYRSADIQRAIDMYSDEDGFNELAPRLNELNGMIGEMVQIANEFRVPKELVINIEQAIAEFVMLFQWP